MIPDILVLSTCAVLIGWGLALLFFAHAIRANNPLRKLMVPPDQPSPSDRMVAHRVTGVFWLCVGVGIAIWWLLEGRAWLIA